MNTIPVDCTVVLPQLTSGSLKAKADTGATICALHATDIVVSGDTVEFRTPSVLGTIRLHLHEIQEISSALGGERRPIVLITVAVEGHRTLHGVAVSLSDRSGMDHEFLLGLNAIEELGAAVTPVSEATDFQPSTTDGDPESEPFFHEPLYPSTPPTRLFLQSVVNLLLTRFTPADVEEALRTATPPP